MQQTPVIYSTITFVNTEFYKYTKMKRRLKCHAFCCHDRYDCLLYAMESEPKDGTKYAIPQNHVSGDEHCELFIPIDIPKEQFRKNYEQ